MQEQNEKKQLQEIQELQKQGDLQKENNLPKRGLVVLIKKKELIERKPINVVEPVEKANEQTKETNKQIPIVQPLDVEKNLPKQVEQTDIQQNQAIGENQDIQAKEQTKQVVERQ